MAEACLMNQVRIKGPRARGSLNTSKLGCEQGHACVQKEASAAEPRMTQRTDLCWILFANGWSPVAAPGDCRKSMFEEGCEQCLPFMA